jgi:superfamily II DNA or RNA helicase
LIEAGHILQADVEIRKTDFFTTLDASTEYSSMLTQLAADYDRNCLIVQDVISEANNGSGVCLVLTDRKNHCDILMELLEREGVNAEVLTGDLGISERRRIVDDLNNGLVNVLVATGQLIGEGFDCKALSTLFLAMPIKFDGRLIQYLGRILRPAPGKTSAKVYDYVDQNVGVLAHSARGRQWIYARKTEVFA